MPEPVREAERRLREWSQDDIHLIQSVRMHEPTYRKPSLLRADVRAFLADRDRLAGEVDRRTEALRDLIENVGGHDHWREGGAGGTCATCDRQNAALGRARAALTDSTEEE